MEIRSHHISINRLQRLDELRQFRAVQPVVAVNHLEILARRKTYSRIDRRTMPAVFLAVQKKRVRETLAIPAGNLRRTVARAIVDHKYLYVIKDLRNNERTQTVVKIDVNIICRDDNTEDFSHVLTSAC